MKILNKSLTSILPPPKIKPSEWCEQHTVFPDGPLALQKTKLFSFQVEPLDATDDPSVQKIVLRSSAQLLKTTILQNAMLYRMANKPSHMIFAGSTGSTVKKFRQGKWMDTINAVPELSTLVTDKSDKNAVNDLHTQQNVDGTKTYFVNMNSSQSLRSLTVPCIFIDELSGVDPDSEEGNPLSLIEQRATQFGKNSLIVMASTPLTPDDMVCQQFDLSDQRHFHVACPHCDHDHILEWENIKFEWVKFNERRNAPDPTTARLHCPSCDEVITEGQRARMVAKGYWKAHRPEVKGFHGYTVSRLYSPITSVEKIVEDFKTAWINFEEQSFYNNVLGLPWVDKNNIQEDITVLENLRDFELDIKKIPDALGIVLACDQQIDRLECSTIAFDEKNIWVCDHRVFYGIDCTKYEDKAYKELLQYSKSIFKTTSGRKVPVLRSFIDSSNGSATNSIYRFCATSGGIWKAIKGAPHANGPISKDSTTAGHQLVNINTQVIKHQIKKLLRQACEGGEYALNIHFSHTLVDDYFLQLTSEVLVRKGSVMVWENKNSERNECLDTLVYAIAAIDHKIQAMGANPYKKLREHRLKQKLKNDPALNTNVEESINTKAEQQPAKRKKKNKGLSALNNRNWF